MNRALPLLGQDASTGSNGSVNILLLGQTGVGKSTLINALLNYLEYPTLREAMAGELKVLIPSKFMQSSTTVLVGEADPQEACTKSQSVGESSTQACRSHFVTLPDDREFQIIDTPGIGDSRGLHLDQQNTEHILQYLNANVDQLHGICILLKPNESRLTPHFMFCLTSLLTNLHKHAANNIMFCYTNSRQTFYSHGDTDGLIIEMLRRIKDKHGQEISYNENNTFFFDSESFRLLACIQHGMSFPKQIVDAFTGSWDKSVEESDRLLRTILGVKPHIVAETVSLNDARKLIRTLSRPLAEIANTLVSNIAKISNQRKIIEETANDQGQLEACRWRRIEVLETTQIDHPRTVCTAKSCIRNVNNVTEYSTICHDPCYLENVPHDTIGHPALQGCSCLDETFNCKIGSCRCNWRLHQHITYSTRRVVTQVEDESVKKQINAKMSTKKIVELKVKQIQEEINKLQGEKETIRTACARYAVFLKENAITPFNDSVDEYLESMIEQRRMMDEMDQVRGLEKLRKELQEEKTVYQRTLAESSSQSSSSSHGSASHLRLRPGDVQTLLETLERLPISGPSLSQQIRASKQCEKVDTRSKTVTHSRPQMKRRNGQWFGTQWSQALRSISETFM